MTEYATRQERYAEIERRLRIIRDCYDLDALAAHGTGPREVAAYYRASDFYYNLIHSRGGHNIHMGLSDDGRFRREDFLKQAQFAAEHIGPESRRVLEVGAGRAANTRYLAGRFPGVSFTALDLPDRNFLRTRVPGNVTLTEGDYHDLSRFEEASFDLVLAVETICHGSDKNRVYHEIARVLKPGGKLIVFDVYEPAAQAEMTAFERSVTRITLAAMCVTAEDQFIGATEAYLRDSGFSRILIRDLTPKIRPSLERLDRLSAQWFRHPHARRLLGGIIRGEAHQNSIAGWLMLPAFDGERLLQYNGILAEKT